MTTRQVTTATVAVAEHLWSVRLLDALARLHGRQAVAVAAQEATMSVNGTVHKQIVGTVEMVNATGVKVGGAWRNFSKFAPGLIPPRRGWRVRMYQLETPELRFGHLLSSYRDD